MKLDQTLLRAILAVGGLLTTGAGLANAEDLGDIGIVRISDHAPGPAPCNTGCQPGTSGPSGHVGMGHVGMGQCKTGCPNGYCGNGYCGNGSCGNGCRSGCFHKCSCTGHVHRFLSWLDPMGGCTLPPDHGWAPPGKIAMWRRPVAYNKFFPDAWTGNPTMPVVPGMPRPVQVYMPTDTTQLGFYYQQVPRWLPANGMVPGAPNPNDWHQPLCNPGYVVGASAELAGSPAPTPAAAPAAEAPAVVAPPAPMADLSAAGEMPSLQPTPR